MKSIGKWLDVATIGGAVASLAALRSLLPRLVMVVTLTILSSMMIMLLLIVGFYALYASLVFYGMAAMTALAITIGAIFVVTAVLVGMTVCRARRLGAASAPELPVVAEARKLAEAFLKGFLEKS